MPLSEENWGLIKQLGPFELQDFEKYPLLAARLNRLLDAARQEERQRLSVPVSRAEQVYERVTCDFPNILAGLHKSELAESSATQEAKPCTQDDRFAHCNFRATGRLDSCRDPGGCLHQTASQNALAKLNEATQTKPDSSSRDLSHADGDGLDSGVLWRLQRYADGEHAKTVYKLPPNGSYDPLRRDIAAVLARVYSPAPTAGESSREEP